MTKYVLGRFAQGAIVLALVAVIVFTISRLSGSPVNQMLPENATDAQRESLTRQLGLDQPLAAQFGLFVVRILGGDFGDSHRFHIPALELVLSRLGSTVALASSALLIAVVIGVTLGAIGAMRRGSWVDRVITMVVTAGQSIPSFWIGILLILVVGVSLGWLPFAGNNSPQSIILPAITLSVVPLVSIARVTRSSILETLSRDYITTARSKGLRRNQILVRHLLRNSAIPVLTVTGLMFAEAIGGAVITEQVFAWPGIGSLAVQAIATRDYAVIQTITLIVAFFVVAISLIVDLAYLLVDPRIRSFSGGKP
jgi:peptide/nickel transport system permease protein